MRTEEQKVAFLNRLHAALQVACRKEIEEVNDGEFMDEVEVVHACIHLGVNVALQGANNDPQIAIARMRGMIQMLVDCFSGQTNGMIQGALNISQTFEANSQEEADAIKENLREMHSGAKRVLH